MVSVALLDRLGGRATGGHPFQLGLQLDLMSADVRGPIDQERSVRRPVIHQPVERGKVIAVVPRFPSRTPDLTIIIDDFVYRNVATDAGDCAQSRERFSNGPPG
jgi:hypothetical protein